MQILTFDNTEKILLAVTGILFIIQVLYYFCLYNRIHARSLSIQKGKAYFSQELPPISVIICAHQECENMRHNLASVLEQDYPEFEVIVINDGDTDESEDFLKLMETKYPHLYHSFVPDSSRYVSRKKLAITLGIKASKNEWLVFTDANCHPKSDQWLRLLARNFTPHTEVVLGYSGYEDGGKGHHKWIALDNLFTAMRHLGFALAGHPYTGVGRNLAYRKETYYKQKGFTAHLNLKRGDDDLFVNQVSNGGNTRVETDANAVTRMRPIVRNKDWREEKIGYTFTAHHYRGMQRWIAAFETMTRLLFYAAWIATCVIGILHFHWVAAGCGLLLFLLRFLMQSIIVNKTAKDLDDPYRFHFTLFLYDLIQPIQSLRWKLHYHFRRKSEFMR